MSNIITDYVDEKNFNINIFKSQLNAGRSEITTKTFGKGFFPGNEAMWPGEDKEEDIVNPFPDYDVYPISEFNDVFPYFGVIFDCGNISHQQFKAAVDNYELLKVWIGEPQITEYVEPTFGWEMGLVFKYKNEYFNSFTTAEQSFTCIGQKHRINIEIETDAETGDSRVVVSDILPIEDSNSAK